MKKGKKLCLILVAIAIYIGSAAIIGNIYYKKYEDALHLMEAEKLNEAEEIFTKLGNYRDSAEYLESIRQKDNLKLLYDTAKDLFDSKNLYEAMTIFLSLGDYKDSKLYVEKCEENLRKEMATTISAGVYSVIAIDSDREVLNNKNEYNKLNISGWNNLASVSIGETVAIGLTSDGQIYTATSDKNLDLNRVTCGEGIKKWEDFNDIIAISAGDQHVIALRSNGEVLSAGNNGDGQGNVTDWSDIRAIATGSRTTVGLDKDGKIHLAGYGNNLDNEQNRGSNGLIDSVMAREDEWKDVVAIDAGGYWSKYVEYIVGLKKDKSVIVAFNLNGPYDGYNLDMAEEWEKVAAISAGAFHIVGLTEDGKAMSTLPNSDKKDVNGEKELDKGCCELESWEEKNYDIKRISAGHGITVGITSEGKVVSRGFIRQGQLDNIGDWNVLKDWN